MNTENPTHFSNIIRPELFKEIILLVILIYMLMVGGTYNGMVIYSLQFANFVLAGGLGLLGGGWLIWKAGRGGITLKTPIDLGLLFWLAVVVLTSLFSTNRRLSWETFAQDLLLVILFYFVVVLIRTGWSEDMWIKPLLISSGVVIVFGLIELTLWYSAWFSIGGLTDLIPPATYRVRATLGHPNIAAAYLNLILPLALAALVKTGSKINRAILVLQIGLILGLVFFTSSRGGWIGTAAALSVFGLLLTLDNLNKAKAVAIWVLKRPLVFAVVVVLLVGGLFIVGLLLYRQMQHPSHPGLSNPVGARDYIWSVAFTMFQKSPLVGLGPQTFGSEFIRTYSYPPSMLLAHSHNYLLNSLAEMGGLGAAAVALQGVLLVRAGLLRWKGGQQGKRTLLAGILASLVGLSVHSQFDTPETVLLINLIAAVLIALLLAPLCQLNQIKTQTGLRMLPVFLWWGGLVLFLGLQIWNNQSAALFNQGVLAYVAGDLNGAARQIDAAAAKDPELAHYWFQAAIAHSELAFYSVEEAKSQARSALLLPVKDNAELADGIAAYQKGLGIDDSNALNWANLGILQWSSGDRQKGIASLERACRQAENSSVLQVLLGWMYEQNAQPVDAAAAYTKALGLSPELKDRQIFKNSPLAKNLDVNPVAKSPGWNLLAEGDFPAAETAFRAEVGLNNSQAFSGLGRALLGQHRYTEAEKALQTADFIEPGSLETQSALERLYSEMGRSEQAKAAAQTVDWLKSKPVTGGPLMQGDPDYAFYIYHRETLVVHLVGLGPLD